MSIFCYKKLDTTSRSGAKLRDARQKLGLSLDYIAERTHIQKKYLHALEHSQFSELPKAKAYRLAYVREFAAWVGLNGAELADQFIKENGLEDAPIVHPLTKVKLAPYASLSILARNLIFICLVIVFAGYLVYQVRGVVQPPELSIFSPAEGYVVSQPSVMVQGKTDKETRLTINGQDIMVSDTGAFQTKIDLSEGVNTLTFVATKKHGKAASLTRHLVMQPRFLDEDKVSLK